MTSSEPLYVVVTKVDGPLYEGPALSVHVPGLAGEMEILKNHTALISPLKKGVVTVTSMDQKKQSFEIEQGVLEVSSNQATILL